MTSETESIGLQKKEEAYSSVDQQLFFKRIAHFFSELKKEIFRIDWTSWEKLKNSTKVVILFTVLFGLVIYVTDLLIQGSLVGLNFLFRLIAG